MEKSLAKEKEKALAKEKEKALVKEKERKQKVVANEIQQTRESFQPRSLLLNDVSVKGKSLLQSSHLPGSPRDFVGGGLISPYLCICPPMPRPVPNR